MAHNNNMSADVLIEAAASTGSGHIDRRQLYQPQGGCMNNRRALKSVVFAMGWKGEVQADLEQAQTHKHQHQI